MDFVSVTERAASEADWIAGLTPMTEGIGLRVRDGGLWPDVLLGLEVRQDQMRSVVDWILDVPG
jgi:hypothetical protein